MVIYSASGWMFGSGDGEELRMPTLDRVWIFYIGLGILSIVGTFGYLFVLAGQWRCLMGSPERHGARWLMFFATTCLFFAPAINVASFIGGMQRAPQLSRGARSLTEMQFTTTGTYMQLASAGTGLLYTLFFLLFLRAVAKCHRSASHIGLVNFFFVLVGGLVAVSGYQLYARFQGLPPEEGPLKDLTLYLAGGWVLCYLFYLFLIGSIRSCIADSLQRVRSPLEIY
jgi:hypothetical protein